MQEVNGIVCLISGGDASGKIGHLTVVFGSVLIWYECCGIDILHNPASFDVSISVSTEKPVQGMQGEKALLPAGFFF